MIPPIFRKIAEGIAGRPDPAATEVEPPATVKPEPPRPISPEARAANIKLQRDLIRRIRGG